MSTHQRAEQQQVKRTLVDAVSQLDADYERRMTSRRTLLRRYLDDHVSSGSQFRGDGTISGEYSDSTDSDHTLVPSYRNQTSVDSCSSDDATVTADYDTLSDHRAAGDCDTPSDYRDAGDYDTLSDHRNAGDIKFDSGADNAQSMSTNRYDVSKQENYNYHVIVEYNTASDQDETIRPASSELCKSLSDQASLYAHSDQRLYEHNACESIAHNQLQSDVENVPVISTGKPPCSLLSRVMTENQQGNSADTDNKIRLTGLCHDQPESTKTTNVHIENNDNSSNWQKQPGFNRCTANKSSIDWYARFNDSQRVPFINDRERMSPNTVSADQEVCRSDVIGSSICKRPSVLMNSINRARGSCRQEDEGGDRKSYDSIIAVTSSGDNQSDNCILTCQSNDELPAFDRYGASEKTVEEAHPVKGIEHLRTSKPLLDDFAKWQDVNARTHDIIDLTTANNCCSKDPSSGAVLPESALQYEQNATTRMNSCDGIYKNSQLMSTANLLETDHQASAKHYGDNSQYVLMPSVNTASKAATLINISLEPHNPSKQDFESITRVDVAGVGNGISVNTNYTPTRQDHKVNALSTVPAELDENKERRRSQCNYYISEQNANHDLPLVGESHILYKQSTNNYNSHDIDRSVSSEPDASITRIHSLITPCNSQVDQFTAEQQRQSTQRSTDLKLKQVIELIKSYCSEDDSTSSQESNRDVNDFTNEREHTLLEKDDLRLNTDAFCSAMATSTAQLCTRSSGNQRTSDISLGDASPTLAKACAYGDEVYVAVARATARAAAIASANALALANREVNNSISVYSDLAIKVTTSCVVKRAYDDSAISDVDNQSASQRIDQITYIHQTPQQTISMSPASLCEANMQMSRGCTDKCEKSAIPEDIYTNASSWDAATENSIRNDSTNPTGVGFITGYCNKDNSATEDGVSSLTEGARAHAQCNHDKLAGYHKLSQPLKSMSSTPPQVRNRIKTTLATSKSKHFTRLRTPQQMTADVSNRASDLNKLPKTAIMTSVQAAKCRSNAPCTWNVQSMRDNSLSRRLNDSRPIATGEKSNAKSPNMNILNTQSSQVKRTSIMQTHSTPKDTAGEQLELPSGNSLHNTSRRSDARSEFLASISQTPGNSDLRNAMNIFAESNRTLCRAGNRPILPNRRECDVKHDESRIRMAPNANSEHEFRKGIIRNAKPTAQKSKTPWPPVLCTTDRCPNRSDDSDVETAGTCRPMFSEIRRACSTSVLPCTFFADSRSYTSLLETDMDTGVYHETPLICETDIDKVNEKTRSMCNMSTMENEMHRQADGVKSEKHKSMLTLSTSEYTSPIGSEYENLSVSENELRVRSSLTKLSIPVWYSNRNKNKRDYINTKMSNPGRRLAFRSTPDIIRTVQPNAGRHVIIHHRVTPSMNVKPHSVSTEFELPSSRLRDEPTRFKPIHSRLKMPETNTSRANSGKITAKEAYLRLKQELDRKHSGVGDDETKNTRNAASGKNVTGTRNRCTDGSDRKARVKFALNLCEESDANKASYPVSVLENNESDCVNEIVNNNLQSNKIVEHSDEDNEHISCDITPEIRNDVTLGAQTPSASMSDHEDVIDEKNVIVKCKLARCSRQTCLAEARKYYKTCHNCYTYYCSRECRKEHWERHKRKCVCSRVGSTCKQVIRAIHDNQLFSARLSRIARCGFLSDGRGFILVTFTTADQAENALKNDLLSIADVCTYNALSVIRQDGSARADHAFELVEMCQTYNPQIKYVINVVIRMAGRSETGNAPGSEQEERVIEKCAKLRLSSAKNAERAEGGKEHETLILTAVPGAEFTENMDMKKARQVCFVNIQRKLRMRGVSLRHQYPQVYNKLCAYVSDNEFFEPITLFPTDSSGKRFMCLLMPNSEPEIDWMDQKNIIEQYGHSTSV